MYHNKPILIRHPTTPIMLPDPTSEWECYNVFNPSVVYHDGLVASDVPRVRRVVNQEFTFAPGIEVTEIEQVKGLEFDYVIVVDVSRSHFPDASLARRRLHVAATRAVHQLWLTCTGTPSALVGELDAEVA